MSDWWEIGQGYDGLHSFNIPRIDFILNTLNKHQLPISGATAIDVGCGGGILTEPLYNLGFNICGIDRDKSAIVDARDHNGNIEFMHADFMDVDHQYDYVIASEVIEHVDDQADFLVQCAKIAKKAVFISTLNRTYKALFKAVLIAEFVLRFIKPGTHQWSKFITPEELNQMASDNNLDILEMQGMIYNYFSNSWSNSAKMDINYIAAYRPLVIAS